MRIIYVRNVSDGEVYRANTAKAIADLASDKVISEDAAKELLDNSDINNPIYLRNNTEEMWEE